jgi:hypothetical protein
MSREKYSPGAVLRIQFADGSFGYGRLREFPFVAFYDFHTKERVSDLNEITSKSILFTLAVHESVQDTWEIIGEMPLEESLKQPVVQFMQDVIDYRKCWIVDSKGNKRQARPEECLGLERAAIWQAQHVERRLLDTFMGRPNRSEEGAKVRFNNMHRDS